MGSKCCDIMGSPESECIFPFFYIFLRIYVVVVFCFLFVVLHFERVCGRFVYVSKEKMVRQSVRKVEQKKFTFFS